MMTQIEKDMETVRTIADGGKVSVIRGYCDDIDKYEFSINGYRWVCQSCPDVNELHGFYPDEVCGSIKRELDGLVALVESRRELLAAMKALFGNCVMVHRCWGDGSNVQEADAAVKQARAAITKAEGGEG